MKPSNLIIRIPEPCHEDWNSMQPDKNGKFCGSCSKSVFDFSNKTDNEIKDILFQYKDQKVCGHFKKTQADRPLNIRINLKELPGNISSTKAFAIALFLVFGTFLFSCTDLKGQKVDTIEVVDPKEETYTRGEVAIPQIENIPEDSLKTCSLTTTGNITESYVNGGISMESRPIIPDTPIVAMVEQKTEQYMLGMMVYIPEEKDSTLVETADSSLSKLQEKNLDPEKNIKQTDLLVYPNPSKGEFTIKYSVLKRADVKVDVFDERGILIKTVVNVVNQFDGNYQIPVSVNELPNGIYLVTLVNGGKRFTDRLILER